MFAMLSRMASSIGSGVATAWSASVTFAKSVGTLLVASVQKVWSVIVSIALRVATMLGITGSAVASDVVLDANGIIVSGMQGDVSPAVAGQLTTASWQFWTFMAVLPALILLVVSTARVIYRSVGNYRSFDAAYPVDGSSWYKLKTISAAAIRLPFRIALDAWTLLMRGIYGMADLVGTCLTGVKSAGSWVWSVLVSGWNTVTGWFKATVAVATPVVTATVNKTNDLINPLVDMMRDKLLSDPEVRQALGDDVVEHAEFIRSNRLHPVTETM